MKVLLAELREMLGTTFLVSLAVVAGVVLFSIVAVKPLERRLKELDRSLEQAAERSAGVRRTGADRRTETLEAFYRFFDRRERPEDWLAKIYGIARASGLELRSADYRATGSRQRLERYEITLPFTGTYAEVRSFLEKALAEVPIMSLEQASYRRKGSKDNRVEAQVVLALYLPRR